VGYLIDGVLGHLENDTPRMVRTPWSEVEMPFEKAAEMGTQKVINEHSTIGLVVTTDGTISGLPRSSYIGAEERVIQELRSIGKPFIVVLNTKDLYSVETQKLQLALEEKYDVPVIPMDVLNMNNEDLQSVLERVLFEFPLRQINISLPKWVQALPSSHYLIEEILSGIRQGMLQQSKMRDYPSMLGLFEESENVKGFSVSKVSLGTGCIEYAIEVNSDLFYKVLGDECGCDIKGDFHLISLMRDLMNAKREYDRIAEALRSVESTGYGVVAPSMEDMVLEEPEMVKQGSRFGVKLKASAPSLHLIKVDITTEISPVIGNEKQSEEMLKYLLSEFETDTKKIWESNLFGKSLHQLVKEGLSNKLTRMPENVQHKMQMTLQRIINEGGGGIICILL
jgi:stage IV sporulation protein A